MKYIITTIAAAMLMLAANAQEAQLKSEVFDLLDLDRPGLEQVKTLRSEGKEAEAATALLDYYKNLRSVT